jgi:uncharacterized protein YndB with AHSA1/START domain
VRRFIKAPRTKVFRALIDPEAIARWKFPAGMTLDIRSFEGREGGTFRISLTYDDAGGTGKTTARTDTYHGRFKELVADERIVEVDEFETDDPAMKGEMTITYTLAEAQGGTDLQAVHEGLPSGVSLADNELGWRMALDNLASLLEAG